MSQRAPRTRRDGVPINSRQQRGAGVLAARIGPGRSGLRPGSAWTWLILEDPVDEDRVGQLGQDVVEGESGLTQCGDQVPGPVGVLEPELAADQQHRHDHQRATGVERAEPVREHPVVRGDQLVQSRTSTRSPASVHHATIEVTGGSPASPGPAAHGTRLPTSGSDHHRASLAGGVGNGRVQRLSVRVQGAGRRPRVTQAASRSTKLSIPPEGVHSTDGAAYRHRNRPHCTCGLPAHRRWGTQADGYRCG